MSSSLHNLSHYIPDDIPSAAGMRVAIAVSEWNRSITGALLEGAVQTLLARGMPEDRILVRWVPGSFELPLAAEILLSDPVIDGVICLGCVIQGETRHFEFICQAVSQGITRVGLDTRKPVIFGVLTTDSPEQALARAGGEHGNKGVEAALAFIRMQALKQEFTENLPWDEH